MKWFTLLCWFNFVDNKYKYNNGTCKKYHSVDCEKIHFFESVHAFHDNCVNRSRFKTNSILVEEEGSVESSKSWFSNKSDLCTLMGCTGILRGV